MAGESLCAVLQKGDELGGVPERIGDRLSFVGDADRGPQLAGHFGDQQRATGDWFGVEGGEVPKRVRVVGICEPDRDAEPFIKRGTVALSPPSSLSSRRGSCCWRSRASSRAVGRPTPQDPRMRLRPRKQSGSNIGTESVDRASIVRRQFTQISVSVRLFVHSRRMSRTCRGYSERLKTV